MGRGKFLYQASEKFVLEFIFEDTFTHFIFLGEIITNHGVQFT